MWSPYHALNSKGLRQIVGGIVAVIPWSVSRPEFKGIKTFRQAAFAQRSRSVSRPEFKGIKTSSGADGSMLEAVRITP